MPKTVPEISKFQLVFKCPLRFTLTSYSFLQLWFEIEHLPYDAAGNILRSERGNPSLILRCQLGNPIRCQRDRLQINPDRA